MGQVHDVAVRSWRRLGFRWRRVVLVKQRQQQFFGRRWQFLRWGLLRQLVT
jgi:hypothetical protein